MQIIVDGSRSCHCEGAAGAQAVLLEWQKPVGLLQAVVWGGGSMS